MFVIGTAGHVDHGKSTLVQKLTGIDPDRLREEKERGLTIDLGFAWLKLPSGREISIVDVPGHERFISNMLAGVGSIDLAMLVIAADEGVMPQTLEHLAIIDLLRIDKGLVVVTKKDLVDDDWLELVTSDIIDALQGTGQEQSKILPVSSQTGEGLPELLNALDTLLEKTNDGTVNGKPRLPIDRVFTVAGFGAVVTGTLIGGSLAVGDEIELVPSGQKGRVRGVQTHKQKTDLGLPGSRVAANISGISHEKIVRGQVLTSRGWLKASEALDVRLRIISGSPVSIKHNAPIMFHLGTSETLAWIRLLDVQELEPGESGWAQIRLQNPIAAVKGDLFVIRSHRGTLGGGEVVATLARRHKRFEPTLLDRLEVMVEGTEKDILIKTVEELEPETFTKLVEATGIPMEGATKAVKELINDKDIIVLGGDQLNYKTIFFSAKGWSSITEKCEFALRNYHKYHPLRAGLSKEELRNKLGLNSQVYSMVTRKLNEDKVIVESGSLIRLPTHARVLTDRQQGEISEYLNTLEEHPYSPSTNAKIDPELLMGLLQEGRVVRMNTDVVFSSKAYEDMKARVMDEIRDKGKINVARVRDMFGTSRKYALALMEHLDQQKITRRIGDDRVIR